MKSKSFIILLFASITASAFAQGAWTQKANYGGPAEYGAVGFSIGTKGYIVCGGTNFTVWGWDQATGVWTQKTSYPGSGSYKAIGFSIGTKGYYGTGNDAFSFNSSNSDFYEFDPVANTWTVKTNVPIATHASVGFSIGSKGYIVESNYCYEYDPSTDSWTVKTPYPGLGREGLSGFSIGSKGYVGCGLGSGVNQTDFWEFDQIANTWTAKVSFPGLARQAAVSFSIGTKGYIGTGFGGIGTGTGGAYYNDFWEWDQSTNSWTAKTNFIGARGWAIGFSIGSKGYLGTGYSGNSIAYNDFLEFDPSGVQGVEELQSSNQLIIYPNPASQILYVKLSQPLQNVTTLKIMDVSGRELLTQSENRQQDLIQVDIASLPAGIYFISIENSREIFVKQ